MFSLSKILGFFALPSNLLFALALLGLVLWGTRLRRLGQWLVAGCLLLLVVIGLAPVGNALILPLEQRFPPWDARAGMPVGIVVLGGAISPDVAKERGQPALNEAAERMTAVAQLARDYPAARIVFTGGRGRLFGGASEAETVVALFESVGIASARVTLEGRARNTWENAVFTRRLVQPKPGERWLLVTSAHHMPRAIGIFRKAGFPVEAYPVDYRTTGWRDLRSPFGSVAAGLARSDAAMHEWTGLVVAWLAGQSEALFPGPATPAASGMVTKSKTF
jgi:uncharacterized SAM-binding protein YcdF (DUF218 family)